MLPMTKLAGLIIGAGLVLSCQAGCGSVPIRPSPSPHVITVTSETQTPRPETDLDFSVTENREGELVFSMTAADFIAAYNGQYEADHGKPYLESLSQWRHFTYDCAPHSAYETEYYGYQSDIQLASMPIISLYIPSNSDYIQEITLGFDHHGYTDWWYEMYEEQCLYVLRLLLPDYDDSQLTELFQHLYEQAERNDKCFFVDALDSVFGTGPQIIPPILYWRDNIGIYPCFICGGLLYVNVIPVTQEYLEFLAENNSELYEIP